MNHTEHPARTESHKAGLFATLRAFLPAARGSGAPSAGHRRRTLLATLTLAALVVLGAATAIADTAPTPTISAPTNIEYTNAHLSGTVNPNGGPSIAHWRFEYSTDHLNWSLAPDHELSQSESEESTPIAVAEDLALGTLQPNTKYFVRLAASNDGGQNLSNEQELTTKAVATPTVTIAAPSGITATTAHFSGHVNPNSPQPHGSTSPAEEDAFKTAWHFECTPACPGLTGELEADNTSHEVSAEATGLLPGTHYEVSLIAENKGGSASAGPQTFTTLPVAPAIASTSATGASATEAILQAQINPGGAATDCHFEYGTEAGTYDHTAACEPEAVGSDDTTHQASAAVTGLEPSTVYYFRVIAHNTVETVQGPDAAFATNPALAGPAAGESCPNPAFHTGLSANLPECRAYELLTPPNKGDGEDMYGDFGEQSVNGGTFDVGFPAEVGDRFYLTTSARFGPFPASGQNAYVFSRAAAGWGFTSLASPALGTQSLTPEVFSPDLSQVGITDHLGSLGNLATYHNAGLVGPPGGPYTTLSGEAELIGASSDLSRVFVQSTEHSLIPGGPAEAQYEFSPALYEYSADHYNPVNVKTNGEPLDPCGAERADQFGSGEGTGTVSAAGSRAFFLSPGFSYQSTEPGCYENNGANPRRPFRWTGTAPQLYLRSAGTTVQVSAPQQGVIDPNGAQPTVFDGASTDGSHAFFITRSELTADDAANHQPELYEWQALDGGACQESSADYVPDSNGCLVRVSRGDSGTAVGDVFWAIPSADGSAIYFTATGQLAPGAPIAGLKLYRYDTATGATTYITEVGSDWSETIAGGLNSLNERFPRQVYSNWEATPDGRYLLFASEVPLTGFDNHDPAGSCGANLSGTAPAGSCAEVYRYDAATASLLCVSCNPSGAAPTANALFDRNTRFRTVRAISDDGSRVFFDTTESLVPTDTNGRLDVYEWHDGEISLISSGQDSSNSYFLGTNQSGADAFFGTHARLVAQDTDAAGDLYDARAGGGFPAPQGSVACEGDACQTPPPTPGDATPASETFFGAGNLHPSRRRHRHHKHHKRSHKRAGRNRGGNR